MNDPGTPPTTSISTSTSTSTSTLEKPSPPIPPEARERVGRAYAELLGVILVTIATLSALLIWHLSRRARIAKERLGPPRHVRWPELENRKGSTDG